MAEYIVPSIETDPDVLEAEAIAFMQTAFAGWQANEGALATWIIRSMANMTSTARDLASDVPLAVFLYFGSSIAGIPPVEATFATATATFTMRDTIGTRTIPADLEVGIDDGTGTLVGFRVVNQVVVAPGAGATAAGGVSLIALEAGAAPNGITGAATLLEPLDFVASVTVVTAPAGGGDAESVEAYANRLAGELRLMAPRPILARDAGVLAQRVATVDRALAIDLYNPDTADFNAEKHTTIVAVDALGEPVTAGTKTTILSTLNALREANFVFHVIDPTYTNVDVTVVGKAVSGFNPTDVDAAATAALTAYLSPLDWGQPRIGDQREWLNSIVVRKFEIAEVLNSVAGFDYIEPAGLTMRIGAGAYAEQDITLPGVAPMPRAGVINVTVNAA